MFDRREALKFYVLGLLAEGKLNLRDKPHEMVIKVLKIAESDLVYVTKDLAKLGARALLKDIAARVGGPAGKKLEAVADDIDRRGLTSVLGDFWSQLSETYRDGAEVLGKHK